jgi:hypothetical protein
MGDRRKKRSRGGGFVKANWLYVKDEEIRVKMLWKYAAMLVLPILFPMLTAEIITGRKFKREEPDATIIEGV